MGMMKPIESAPKDGTRIVVFDNTGAVAAACWTGDMWAYPDTVEQIDLEPTKWAHLDEDWQREFLV
jgi:hypothetical protein